MKAYCGPDLRCPVCGRPQHAVTLRDGDALVTCWKCKARVWAVRVPGAQPTAVDVAAVIGPRLAASVLATYAPAPVVTIALPVMPVPATRLELVARVTQVLIGDRPHVVAEHIQGREAA